MARIKNRQLQIPGGLKFYQPETGWRAPQFPSFDTLVRLVMEHRRANPHLAKQHNWKMTRAEVEEEMDAYNAKICLDHGWTDYIMTNAQDSPSPLIQPHSRNVAGRAVVGLATLSSWMGEGGKPVEYALSTSRAEICATCPQNKAGDWTSWFTEPAAALIRKQLELRNDLKLVTPSDDKLNVCDACGCPLKLKVHVPIVHILKRMPEGDRKALDPRCWILSETK